jgi:hypothetical protein
MPGPPAERRAGCGSRTPTEDHRTPPQKEPAAPTYATRNRHGDATTPPENVRIIDRPATESGRSYLVERELEQEGPGAYAALQALVADYLKQARLLMAVPMASSASSSIPPAARRAVMRPRLYDPRTAIARVAPINRQCLLRINYHRFTRADLSHPCGGCRPLAWHPRGPCRLSFAPVRVRGGRRWPASGGPVRTGDDDDSAIEAATE